MSRFINKQQHKNSCGPVAVMNALKWLGYSVNYREEINEFKKSGWNFDGVGPKEINTWLKEYGVKYKLHKKPTLAKMRKIVRNGNSMIFGYNWSKPMASCGHVVFMDFHSYIFGGHFNVYNMGDAPTNMVHDLHVEQLLFVSKAVGKYIPDEDSNNIREGAYVWEIIK